jgi:hypothetical protein
MTISLKTIWFSVTNAMCFLRGGKLHVEILSLCKCTSVFTELKSLKMLPERLLWQQLIASQQNPKHDIYIYIYIHIPSSGHTVGIRVMCCTNTHTYLSCDVGPVKAYYAAACIAGSLFQT